MGQRISLSERKVNALARHRFVILFESGGHAASLRPIRRRLSRRFPGHLHDRARTTIRTVELGDCVVAPRQPESLPVTRGASRGAHRIGISHHRTIDPTIRPSVATEPKWLSNTASSDRAHYGEGQTRVLCHCRMRHVPPSSTNTIARRFTTAFPVVAPRGVSGGPQTFSRARRHLGETAFGQNAARPLAGCTAAVRGTGADPSQPCRWPPRAGQPAGSVDAGSSFW